MEYGKYKNWPTPAKVIISFIFIFIIDVTYKIWYYKLQLMTSFIYLSVYLHGGYYMYMFEYYYGYEGITCNYFDSNTYNWY